MVGDLFGDLTDPLLIALAEVDSLRAGLFMRDGVIARLTAALKVCEEALHCTAILRDDPLEPAGDVILYAAQQASGAYWSSWQPGQQERDDEGGTDG